MKRTEKTLLAPLLCAALFATAPGCKNDEPPPPLPQAAPAPSQATLQLKALDAHVEEIDAAAPKPTGKGGGGGGLGPCCQALAQNANLAPEPTASYMKQAAAICMASQSGGTAVLSMIRAALKGANMPAACK